MRSLEGRLQIGLALSLAALVAAFWFLGHHALHRMMESFIVSRLQHDADAVLAALHTDEDGRPEIGWRRLTPVYNQPQSGHYFVLEGTGSGPIYSPSLWDDELEIPALRAGETRLWHMPGPGGQALLVWAGGYEKAGLRFTLAMAEDISPLAARLRNYEWFFAATAVAGLLLMVLIQRLVIHQTFRRLQPVFDDIRRLERGEAFQLREDVPREIHPLVHKFNGLLHLIQDRLTRSRNAAGNLAHALKTPLSLLLHSLEDPALNGNPRLRASLEQQVQRIRVLMDRELKRARMAGSGGPGQRFDPGAEIPTLLEVLKQMYRSKPLAVEYRVDGAQPMNADREDMLELLGNLLDNAFKWARSRVRCGVTQTGADRIEYTIEDDGPGCDEQMLERIQERGARMDEAVEGHGLGLAIARDVVRLYGGTFTPDRSPELGGFRVRVVLPRS